tara:strand:+ start:295 stop:678 length:384 start_codon:yes stop_codon:yes gene_type:complete
MDKDWNHIAKIEKAINQKYGKEAIINPNSEWSEDKEKEYIEQLKEMNTKQASLDEQQEKVEADGFLINKKLLTREAAILSCSVCSKRLKTVKDDIYNNKFECCHKCYIEYVDGREDRWLEGWRPGEN